MTFKRKTSLRQTCVLDVSIKCSNSSIFFDVHDVGKLKLPRRENRSGRSDLTFTNPWGDRLGAYFSTLQPFHRRTAVWTDLQ